MPSNVIPVGFAQATHVFTGEALPYGAVITYGIDVQGTAETPDEIAESLYGIWQLNWVVDTMGGGIRHSACRVKLGPNSTGVIGEYTGEGVGENITVSPANTALLATKNTNLGGRQGKGRLFLPGVAEGLVDNAGRVTPASVPTLNLKLSEVLGAMNGDDLPMVLLHYNAVAPTPVVNMTIGQTASTQRRRMRR